MSYALGHVRKPDGRLSYRGPVLMPLGYDVQIDTPVGVQTVSFDLDKVSRDVSKAIMTETWPELEARATQLIERERDEAFHMADERIKGIKRGVVLFAAALGVTWLGVSWLGRTRRGKAWGT